MEINEQLSQLGVIAASVYAFIEFLKPYITIYFAPIDGLSDDAKAAVYRLLNIIFCVGIVVSSGNTLNLLIDNQLFGQQIPLLGMIITGVATGLGSTVLNFLSGWATLKFITIPTLEALKIKAEALKVLSGVPMSVASIEEEIKAEQV